MSIATHAKTALEQSSWIRRMFEHGAILRQQRGEDAIVDLSLGNPDLSPPAIFYETLRRLIAPSSHHETNDREHISAHRYMNNAGFLETRSAIAKKHALIEKVPLTADDVLMTVGAAGGLNCILRTLLNPGEEVIFPAPYFAEYPAYVRHSQGQAVIVQSRLDFGLSIKEITNAITPQTKVLLLNSPNNPTGSIYTNDDMRALGDIANDRNLYVIMDAAYARMCYGTARNPSVLEHIDRSFVVHSHSKDLGLAGERLGFVLINPTMPEVENVRAALIMMNRSLGFVNAPALMQRALPYMIDAAVDIDTYRDRVLFLGTELTHIGYTLDIPKAGFFLWVKVPGNEHIPDRDAAFCTQLAKDGVLTVPGSGFGYPGYMRIACCVNQQKLHQSVPIFARAFEQSSTHNPASGTPTIVRKPDVISTEDST